MLPRVEDALLSHFLSSSLLPPRSHSHGLLSRAGLETLGARDGADPQDTGLEQVVERIWSHCLSGRLVKLGPLDQEQTRA